MIPEVAFGCRHTIGSVNDCCVNCGQKVPYNQKQYSSEQRRILEVEAN